jgi:hypothetical protein
VFDNRRRTIHSHRTRSDGGILDGTSSSRPRERRDQLFLADDSQYSPTNYCARLNGQSLLLLVAGFGQHRTLPRRDLGFV